MPTYQISFVYLQIFVLYSLGVVLTAPGGYPLGVPELLKYKVSLVYNSIALQVPTNQISTVYLQKCRFYGLGVVLTAPGCSLGYPEGAPEPLRHGVSLSYNSTAFQVLTYQISSVFLPKCVFYDLGALLGLLRAP